MVKQKLKVEREKQFTQEAFAFKLGIDASNYNRRENGHTKISKKDWDKMAKELNVKFEEIYEPEDGVYVINNENASGNFGNHNIFNGFNEFAFETMKKYILMLEEKNLKLEQENQDLKNR